MTVLAVALRHPGTNPNSKCLRTNKYSSPMASRILSKIFSTKPNDPAAVLHGTVAYHRSYILLSAPSSPQSFPSRFSTSIHRALQLQTTQWGGLVNFAWTGSQSESSNSLTAFSALNGLLQIPSLTLDNVTDVAEQLRQHATVPSLHSQNDKLHIYVCTHGARDCRCGDTGGAVFRALREEIDARTRVEPNGTASRVVLGEVAHVGGHQFAANMLVFPHGEWFGRLTPSNVPTLLDAILSSKQRPLSVMDPPLSPKFWRGRMGLHKEQQMSLMKSS
ncbi:Sucrase/ferredoxin-like-domain-containing protein [Mycena amicta]|nr:Sucrase/ferredoxin-like-domain-containing protein [Mycena amicta]